jgi:hypothetical protein
MAKANKTQPTTDSVDDFLAAVEHPVRRADAQALCAMMQRVSGEEPVLWGSIVGFGTCHYRYESGRQGDFMRVGFSPRKSNLVLYLMPGVERFPELLERLGKHKHGKSCLYVNKLADVDVSVLEELTRASLDVMAERYPE